VTARRTVDRSRAALFAAIDEFGASDAGDAGTPESPRGAAAGDWSLAAEALRFLALLVRRLEPRQVLEFGSGSSTAVLGRSCADLEPPSTVVTIENDPVYAARARAGVAREGLDRTVRVVSAPIVVRRCHDRNVPVYLIGEDPRGVDGAVGLGRPDLILVDGPPLPLGGREGALYQALHAAHEGTAIVLDDSRRESERDLLVGLLELFDGHVEAMDLLGFRKGLAIVIVTEPIGSDDFPKELING
jgi:hypothetical protein